MKNSRELIDKATLEMQEAARHISEASVYLMESMLRHGDIIPHRDKYANVSGQLRRLREKIEKASRDFRKLN